MWLMPCSFLTVSLTLQTCLLFFLLIFHHLHPLFFSFFLHCFHYFFPPFLASAPTYTLPFIFASTSVHFFIAYACSFPSSPSLSFSLSQLWVLPPTLCHSACIPVFSFLHGSLIDLLSLCLHLCLFCSILFVYHFSVSALYNLRIILLPSFSTFPSFSSPHVTPLPIHKDQPVIMFCIKQPAEHG